MKHLILQAPAKINLGFSILGRLPNGYHEVKTIYTQVSLFDSLEIEEKNEDKIEIHSDKNDIPTDRKNLVYQAVELIKNVGKVKKGVKIFLRKRVPVGAALGGGSSNAAQTLIGLNKIWQLELSMVELIKLGKILGADVAYHLIGGVQLETQGGGQAGRFTSLTKLPSCLILVCFPNIKITSSQAYSQIEYDEINRNNLSLLVKAINNKDLNEIGKNLHNDFENWTFKKYPVIRKTKENMRKYGALGSLMSGKGSSVFGIFTDKKEAELVTNFLKKDFSQTFLVKPL